MSRETNRSMSDFISQTPIFLSKISSNTFEKIAFSYSAGATDRVFFLGTLFGSFVA
jgi:hypothetical protein